MNRFEKGSPCAEKSNFDTMQVAKEVFDRDFCSKLRPDNTAAAASCMLPKLELVDCDSGKAQKLKHDEVSKNFDRIKQFHDGVSPESSVSGKSLPKHAEETCSKYSERKQEKETLLRHFAQADKDGAGRVSWRELNAHIGSMQERLNNESSQSERDSLYRDMTVLHRINAKFGQIRAASDDEFFFEHGVSRRDLHFHAKGDGSN